MADEPTTLAALIEAQAEALGAMIPILMKQPERPNDADNPVGLVFSAACPASVWAEFERRFAVRIFEVDDAKRRRVEYYKNEKAKFRDALPKTGTHRIQKSGLKREGVGPDTWDRESHRG